MRHFLAKMLILLLFTSVCLSSAGAEMPPKYVFLFIGDGMGLNQVSAAAYTRVALEEDGYKGNGFLNFEHIGLMTTHSLSGSVTDSAASATAMASGAKVHNGALNYNGDLGIDYEPLPYLLKENGYGIGVITTVTADHATPAAFYSVTDSRYNYLSIARQGFESGILDFWGAGGFSASYSLEGGRNEISAMIEASPFTVVKKRGDLEALTSEQLPVLVLAEDSIANPYMAYELDRRRTEKYGGETIPLSLIVEKAIETLSANGSFFIMCEAGKIDHACANQDIGGMIYEVFALEDAVAAAMRFADKHPDDTLIVVLGDHETGGLRIRSNADWSAIANQNASYARFVKIVDQLYEDQATTADFLASVAHYFLLGVQANLTESEVGILADAFDIGSDPSAMTSSEANHYLGLHPAAYTACTLIQGRSRAIFDTTSHTGQPVPVYASGKNAELFAGIYDNTDIYIKLKEIMQLDES